MSLDIDTRMRVWHASAPQDRHRIMVLQFSHSMMTKVYVLWGEPYEGVITTEDGEADVEHANFKVDLAGSQQNLDQNFEILLDTTDIADEFREQLDRVPLDTEERIRCVYREYLSDDLTAMVVGPAVLQVESVSWEVGAASITAVSPRLSMTRTGVLYSPRDIPMLRAFL